MTAAGLIVSVSVLPLQRVLLAIWVGAAVGIGYVAAPVLFSTLDDRMLAGMLAGKMFAATAWLGLACGTAILLLHAACRNGRTLPRVILWCVVVMLLLTAVGHFGLQPMMADLKTQAAPGEMLEGALRESFAIWHGVSSVLFLGQNLLGVVALWRAR